MPLYSKSMAPSWPMASVFLLISSAFLALLIINKLQNFFFFNFVCNPHAPKANHNICAGIQYLFSAFIIYFWLLWVSVAAYGLPLVEVIWDYSSLRCGNSLQWLLLLQSLGLRCTGFSSCSPWAQQLQHPDLAAS